MNKPRWILVTLLALALVSPAFAGEKGHKCSEETQTCLNMMAQKLSNRGWVGIEMDQDEETGAMTVTEVVPDSPAQASGLKVGDVLLALNGIEFSEENKEKMYQARKDWAPGTAITYTVSRKGKSKEIRLSLAQIPEDVVAQWIGHHLMTDHAVIEVAQH